MIISGGKLIASDTTEGLIEKMEDPQSLETEVVVEASEEQVREALENYGLKIKTIRPVGKSLEDVFLKLTEETAAEAQIPESPVLTDEAETVAETETAVQAEIKEGGDDNDSSI